MDKIDQLNWNLKKIKESFDLWKNSGLNQELLIIFIQHKTKLSKHQVKLMLSSMDDFFDKLITEEVTKNL